MAKTSKDAAKSLPRGSKERKRSLRGSRAALKSTQWNPTPSAPPFGLPPYASLLQLSSVAKDAFRHPPHLAGVLDPSTNSIRAPEEVYLIPPPPLAAVIPPTQTVDRLWTAHGSPTGMRELALGAILTLSWSSSMAFVRRLGRLMRLLFPANAL